MVEISEQAKVRACELANASEPTANWRPYQLEPNSGVYVSGSMRALIALVQQVSDAAKEAFHLIQRGEGGAREIAPFILPDPVDELLVEALATFSRAPGSASHCGNDRRATVLRAALAEHGLKIVEASK